MNKISQVFLASALLFLSQMAAATLEDTDCFSYYQFQTGLLFKDLSTEKNTYFPGDDVTVFYSPYSQMDAPIVQGSVRIQIFYNDPNEGEQMIDEFWAARDINLFKGTIIKNDKFKWTLPENAKPGTYTIKAYFIVGEAFNLAGLSILPYGPPGVPGDLTTFEVIDGTSTSRIYFSKNSTTVNGEVYEFAAPAAILENGNITVKTKLVNEGPAKTVNLTMNVYEWADLSGEPLAGKTVEKTVDLPENGTQDVTYDVSGLTPATYEIVFSAESGDEKSLLKLRTPVSGEKGRFIYLGIDKFPLSKDDNVTLFACYSGSADYSTAFNGTLNVEVTDESGNVVFKDSTGPFEVITTPPQAKKDSFKPGEDLSKLTIKATLYDDKNVLQDSVSLDYDYSKFKDIAANLAITIPKNSFQPGEKIPYTITYKDDKGIPLDGKIEVYLTNEKNKIVDLASDVEMSGEYNGTFDPQEAGEYIMTAREINQDTKAEEAINVSEEATPTTSPEEVATTMTEETQPPETTEEPTQPQSTSWLIIGVAVILIAAAIIIKTRRSGK